MIHIQINILYLFCFVFVSHIFSQMANKRLDSTRLNTILPYYHLHFQVCPSCRAFFRRSVQSGYNLTYVCPDGMVFDHDWFATPGILLTCQVCHQPSHFSARQLFLYRNQEHLTVQTGHCISVSSVSRNSNSKKSSEKIV